MPATKIAIIGAGSSSFGLNTLATLMRSRLLEGSCIALVDLDTTSLTDMVEVAKRMNEAWQANMAISASTDRRNVLKDCQFVVVSIEVQPREALWRLDWEIPLRHGLHQPYGENGGPGGLMHAFRQIPMFLELAADMEALCPNALLINFSNPLPRITRAVTKFSRIKVVGKCHQLSVGYGIAGVLLADYFGYPAPASMDMHSDPANLQPVYELAELGRQHVVIKAAGLNHFTWMIDVRDRNTGEDLYPVLRSAAESAPAGFEPLGMELFRLFGYCPVPGDSHLCEYLPWTHDPITRPWERYNLRLYDWDANEASRRVGQDRVAQMAGGALSVEGLRRVPSEGAAEVIEAITGNLNVYDETVNLSNAGSIPNLPPETIVEIPALIGGQGVQGVAMDPLPEPIGELCRREAALVEMLVDAAATGSRELALQCLLVDPMINDIDRARAILDDYLTEFDAYLPQFAQP